MTKLANAKDQSNLNLGPSRNENSAATIMNDKTIKPISSENKVYSFEKTNEANKYIQE